jgi:hypothetical protein
MFTVFLLLAILVVAVGGASVAPNLFRLTKNDKDR